MSPREGTFEYWQYMFWLRNWGKNFQLHTLNCRPATQSQKQPCFDVLEPNIVRKGYLDTIQVWE